MTKVAIPVPDKGKVKVILRPKRSAAWVKNIVPMNSQVKRAAVKLERPVNPNNETVVRVNILSANMAGAIGPVSKMA
jgi:hypothetical protein